MKKSFLELFEEKKEEQNDEDKVLAKASKTTDVCQQIDEQESDSTEIKGSLIDKSDILKVFDATHQPGKINFRDKQEKQIKQFIELAMEGKLKCRCLLLTGMPGAGKTLLSRRILDETEGIKTIIGNGNVFSDFVEDISKKLVGAKLPLYKLIDKLKESKKKQKVFIFVDEFDCMFRRESAEFLNIFELFNPPINNISLIGTSNSMQIMQTLTQKYKLSLPQLKNIVFSPYTPQQIRTIIQSRLSQVKQRSQITITFQQIALRYTATKLSNAKGGDLRFIFGQIKAIVSVALGQSINKSRFMIKFQHASAILSKFNKLVQGSALMQTLPFQLSVVLIAVYQIYTRQQCLEIPIKKLQKQAKDIFKVLHLQSQLNNISQIVNFLLVYGFISTRMKKKQLQICLTANLKAIKNAFEDDKLLGRFFWE